MIVTFYFNYNYSNNVIKNIIYNSVMSCNMAGISYIVSPFHCLRMPNTFTRCFCYTIQNLS